MVTQADNRIVQMMKHRITILEHSLEKPGDVMAQRRIKAGKEALAALVAAQGNATEGTSIQERILAEIHRLHGEMKAKNHCANLILADKLFGACIELAMFMRTPMAMRERIEAAYAEMLLPQA